MKNLFQKTPQPTPKEHQRREDYITAVAPEAVELGEDYLLFPKGVLFPLSVRGSGAPGMADRPWARLSAQTFGSITVPSMYSVSLRRESPDTLSRSLRSRRTFFEGVLQAAAQKTGRRPSQAERIMDHAMDSAESALTLGEPAYQAALMVGLFASRERVTEAESARRSLEANLRAKGLLPQRLVYIARRSLYHFQPGGILFPGLDEPTLMLEEALSLLPPPTRRVMPTQDAVWVGVHSRSGRDVYFSFKHGFDPSAPSPPHATTLLLGEMGAGKTSLMRSILLQRLLQGRTVVSIDPEGENNHLCEAVGGKVIPAGIPNDPETCLLHPLQASEPAEMLLAVRFLAASLGGESTLTPEVQAALHEAVKRRWERRPGAFSISGLVETLGAVNVPQASIPMSLLRPYMHGGLFDGFFDRPKALLSPDFPPGEWWNFDLSTLREENRDVVHAVLAWFLYHAVTVGRRPMDVFVDEGWRLLRSGPFTDLLDELGRRARKRDVGVTLTTHLPADLMANPTSLSMASTAMIGRMGPDEAFAFFRSLGVSESESERNAEQVSRLPPHVFLAAPSGGRGALFPVRVTIPPMWLQFWKKMGTTN